MAKTLAGGVTASVIACACACAFASALAAGFASAAQAQTSRPDSAAPGDSLAAPVATAAGRTPHQLPEGYLGISFVCDVRRQYGPEGLTIYHYGYPAVESVERGSPADRAGIVPGDTIVAYDSRDVLYRRIVLSRLLRPGSVLAVRVRRNGAVKNLRVSIAPRPATFVDMNVAGYGGTPQAQSGGTASLDPHQWLVMPSRTLPPGGPTGAQRASADPDESPASYDDAGDADDETATIAGAEFIRTNSDLRDALALDTGILVVAVGAGSPAAQAGLRAGDVVVTARGDAIGTPQALAGVLRQAKRDDQPVSLRVVRRHQTRTVVLRSNAVSERGCRDRRSRRSCECRRDAGIAEALWTLSYPIPISTARPRPAPIRLPRPRRRLLHPLLHRLLQPPQRMPHTMRRRMTGGTPNRMPGLP